MEKYFHVNHARRTCVMAYPNFVTKAQKGQKSLKFLRKANQMKTKRCKRPFQELGGGGEGFHVARMNFKTSCVGVYKCFR